MSHTIPSSEVVQIRRLRRQGMSAQVIALTTGHHRGTVYRWMDKLSDGRAKEMIVQLAADHLSQREVRRQLGLGYLRFKRLLSEMKPVTWFDPMAKSKAEKLDEHLMEMAERGLSMRQAALALGINREKVRLMAAAMGDENPWGPREVASIWKEQSGETVAQTARRLADTHTLIQVATLIGYGDGRALRKALIARNVHVKFAVDPRNEARWHRKSA